MMKLGFPAWALSIAARIGAILPSASSASPLTSNLHQGRVPVRGNEPRTRVLDRRHDVRDVRLPRKRADDVRDRGREGRVVVGRRGRLDEHALACRNGEVALVEDLLGAPRLAVRDRPGLHLLCADRAGDGHGDDTERNPAERRALPVRRAPAPCAAREVRGRHGQPPALTVRGHTCLSAGRAHHEKYGTAVRETTDLVDARGRSSPPPRQACRG
jgi:hypothetical protein